MKNNETPLAFTLLLGVLIALPALGTDLYIPALPEVSRSLDAPVAATQATLTMYFVGLAGGQLIWGPLSDRYGRKPVLAAGLSTLIVSSLAAAEWCCSRSNRVLTSLDRPPASAGALGL